MFKIQITTDHTKVDRPGHCIICIMGMANTIRWCYYVHQSVAPRVLYITCRHSQSTVVQMLMWELEQVCLSEELVAGQGRTLSDARRVLPISHERWWDYSSFHLSLHRITWTASAISLCCCWEMKRGTLYLETSVTSTVLTGTQTHPASDKSISLECNGCLPLYIKYTF